MRRSWTIKMAGIPIVKERCFVLWWKKRIPNQAPMLPPRMAERNSVFSGIRHLWWLALYLSAPNRNRADMFMRIR